MAVMDRPAPFGRHDAFSPSRHRHHPSSAFGRSAELGGREQTLDPSESERPRDRVRDLSALALLAAGLFLIAAITTFNPADPPAARVFPPNSKAVNACGLIGSTIASFLYQTFGLGASVRNPGAHHVVHQWKGNTPVRVLIGAHVVVVMPGHPLFGPRRVQVRLSMHRVIGRSRRPERSHKPRRHGKQGRNGSRHTQKTKRLS